MEDCQNEHRYCPNCGQKAELDGHQYHAAFCVGSGLTSLGEQAQTLAARMGQAQVGDAWAQALGELMKEENERQAQNQLVMEDYWRVMGETFSKRYPVVFGALANSDSDPDGALTPLPVKPAPQRTVSAPSHDFIGALYKPYMSPI